MTENNPDQTPPTPSTPNAGAPTGAAGGGTPTGSGTPTGGQKSHTAVWITLIIVVGVIVIAALVIWAVLSNQGASPAPSASPTASASPTPTADAPATDAAAVPTCTIDQLDVELGEPSGAAGSTVVPIVFTNVSASDCLLEGYPGVSFVGDENGTQIGAAAKWDETVDIVYNTMATGDSVQAQLTVLQAANVEGCEQTPTDGFRVYPPHSVDAVFLATTEFTACANDDDVLISVQPVLPAV